MSVAGGSAGGTDHMTLGFIAKALGVEPSERLRELVPVTAW